MKDNIQIIILRVGNKYKEAPKDLRIYVGKIIAGDVKISPGKDKRGGNINYEL